MIRFLLLSCALLCGGVPSAAAAVAGVAPAVERSSEPVHFDGAELFWLHRPFQAMAVSERAERVEDRLKRLAENRAAAGDGIKIVEGKDGLDLMSGNRILLTVTALDAAAEKLEPKLLAERNAAAIRAALDRYRKSRGLLTLLSGLALAMLCTLALLAAMRLLNQTYALGLPKLEDFLQRHMPRARFQGVDLLPGDQLVDGVAAAAAGTRYLILGLMLYIYLPLVFSFFPWTRGYAGILFGYFLGPVRNLLSATLGFIPDFFVIVVMVGATVYLQKIVRTVFRELGRGRIVIGGFYADWAEPTFQIVRVLIWAFTIVAVFPYLPGSNSPAFRGMSVFIGVLLSFGSSSAISNGVAGIILTYMRPFQLGDRVKIAETVGDIVDRSILVTRVRTIKNVQVTIPNAMVLSSHIVNYSTSAKDRGLILHTTVTIGYDVPWKTVHELLVAAAKGAPGVLTDPAPFVLQTALGDFSVAYEINAYTDEPSVMAKTYSALHANIHDAFNAAGVEIMSPVFEVRREGPASTVPAPPSGEGSVPPEHPVR